MDHGYLEIKFTKESSQEDGEDIFEPVLIHLHSFPQLAPQSQTFLTDQTIL